MNQLAKANPEIVIGGDPNGTYLQGHLNCTYAEVCAILGTEDEDGGDSYKVDAEWVRTLKLPDGESLVFTLYNYKDGKNYLGDEGFEKEQITDWHIGGRDPKVVGLVQSLFAA